MNQIMSWFTDKLAPGMQKIFSNPWVGAVASAMQKILPFILVGSVVSIYNVFVRYIPSLPDMSFVNTFSFGMMSLIVSFMVAYFGMVELDHPKYTITAGLTSLTVFLMALCPTMATLVKNAATGKTELTITDINFLGGKRSVYRHYSSVDRHGDFPFLCKAACTGEQCIHAGLCM